MRSKSILSGINVPISPTATTDARLTNNITISNVIPSEVQTNESVKNDEKVIYKTDTNNNPYNTYGAGAVGANAYRDVKPSTFELNDTLSIEKRNIELQRYLLKLYQSILLSENKKLMANAVLRDSIILTQEDLEKVVELKIGKKCVITLEPYDVGCFGSSKVFMKIDSIRIVEEDGNQSDFKIKYNREFLELITEYSINLKLVLVYS